MAASDDHFNLWEPHADSSYTMFFFTAKGLHLKPDDKCPAAAERHFGVTEMCSWQHALHVCRSARKSVSQSVHRP